LLLLLLWLLLLHVVFAGDCGQPQGSQASRA
jgi:hypothetical protein